MEEATQSGTSGQTLVTEDDISRFKIPCSLLENIEQIAKEIDRSRSEIQTKRDKLDQEERTLFARISV